MDSFNKRRIGNIGENAAAAFLSKKAYKIIHRNYRFGKIGEIDIIAQYGEYICFIEVKARRNINYGIPCESVDFRKQKRIAAMASMYMDRFGLYDKNIRFDIIEVILANGKNEMKVLNINHIENAFHQ